MSRKILDVLEFHAEMRAASGKPNLARELFDVRESVAQLIQDQQVALETLVLEGGEDSPLAAFLRASLARAGYPPL